ncbi:MAG: GNAT family N-acetyltransferase [Lewinellaceae bacterium]|nr:GNAT family N-acetyltransferase [Saprospiraceae bacterium]MCB9332572.1 GNAT family N-acetyltransferase [Lewinellaceae bacterium]
MSGSKTPYSEFCRVTYVPLHLQPWWLDAVCGPDNWGAAITAVRQGIPMGVMPYFKTRRMGLPIIQQPPFTAYAGPWFHSDVQYAAASWYKQQRILENLIDQLPRVVFFQQCFHPSIQNWLPFYWTGFHQTTRYTHLLPGTIDTANLYDSFKSSLRTELRRAAEYTEVMEVEDPEPIFRLNKLSFARKGLRQPYSLSTFQRLYQALVVRRQALALLACNRKTGTPQAGLYLVFDARQASVLLTGLDPAYRQTGTLHGLYWHAIQYCAARKLRLDFEGSMQPGIEHVFRGFGGQRTPYMQIWRY